MARGAYRGVRVRTGRLGLLTTCALACLANSAVLAGEADDRQMLLQRLQQLEQRLNQIEGRAPGAPAAAPAPAVSGNLDTQAILQRLDALDQRLSDLEVGAVLSEPKINVKE